MVRECHNRLELGDLVDKPTGTTPHHDTLANKHKLTAEERLATVKGFNNDEIKDNDLLGRLHREVQVTNPHNSWLYTKILALEFPSEVTEMRLSRTLLHKKFEKIYETYTDILKVSVQRQRIEKMDVMESYRIANKKPDHKESAFEKVERDSRLRHFERMNKTRVSKTRALALDLDKDDVLRTLGAIPQAASSSSGHEGTQPVPSSSGSGDVRCCTCNPCTQLGSRCHGGPKHCWDIV